MQAKLFTKVQSNSLCFFPGTRRARTDGFSKNFDSEFTCTGLVNSRILIGLCMSVDVLRDIDLDV